MTDAAPALADPSRGGMPELLRDAFGETYSTDVITCRCPHPRNGIVWTWTLEPRSW